jgi:hypothetical protein
MTAALVTQSFPKAGGAIAYATTGGSGAFLLTTTGNTAPTGPGIALLVKNGSASPITVNLVVPTAITADGLPVTTPFPVTVANGADDIIPLSATRYADPSIGGLCTFGFSATPTTVSVAAISTN